MKQDAQIVITGYKEIRLTISLKSITEKQESKLIDKAIQFYKGLIYQLNEEDELERGFYEEQDFNIDLEDGIDEDSIEDDDYAEDYEFDYHRYK